MKYLTNDTKELCKDKLFYAMSNYRIIKYKISLLQKIKDDKKQIIEKYNKDKEDKIKEIEDDEFKAPELKKHLKKEVYFTYGRNLIEFEVTMDNSKTLYYEYSNIVRTQVNILYQLEKTGKIEESEIEKLQSRINAGFFEPLIAKLSNSPQYITDINFNFSLNDKNMESWFEEEATNRVVHCKTDNELCKIVSLIGLFASENRAYPSEQVKNSLESYFNCKDESIKEDTITRTYKLREMAKLLKDQNRKMESDIASVSEYRKSFSL